MIETRGGVVAAAALIAAAAVLGGCKNRIQASGGPYGSGVIVVQVSVPKTAKVTVNGKSLTASSPRLHFAALEFPLDAKTVDVEVEMDGKTEKIVAPLERNPVEPKLVIETAGNADAVAHCSEFCRVDGGFGVVGAKLFGVLDTYPGVTVEIAGQKVVASPVDLENGPSKEKTVIAVDLRDRVRDAQADKALAGALPLELPIKVIADTTKESVLKFPGDVLQRAMWKVAEEIEKGPISFGADDVAKGAPRSLVIAGDQFVGAPAKFRDVDLIAVSHDLPERKGQSCGPYTGKSGVVSPPLYMLDRSVKVYDRRTGKVVKEKTFDASTTCPDSVVESQKEVSPGVWIPNGVRAQNRVPVDKVRAWVKTLLKP